MKVGNIRYSVVPYSWLRQFEKWCNAIWKVVFVIFSLSLHHTVVFKFHFKLSFKGKLSSFFIIPCARSLSGLLPNTEMKHLPELSCEDAQLWSLPPKINLLCFSSTNVLQTLVEYEHIISTLFFCILVHKSISVYQKKSFYLLLGEVTTRNFLLSFPFNLCL